MDLPREGILQLPRNSKIDQKSAGVPNRASLSSAERFDIFEIILAHPVVGSGAVHHDSLDVLSEKVADGAFDEIRFLERAGRRRLAFNAGPESVSIPPAAMPDRATK